MRPPGVRYQAIHCRLIGERVWAVETRTAGGEWQIANCLDKDIACYGTGCAFTTPEGAWPFGAREPDPQKRNP